jgi:hypothetical protein
MSTASQSTFVTTTLVKRAPELADARSGALFAPLARTLAAADFSPP